MVEVITFKPELLVSCGGAFQSSRASAAGKTRVNEGIEDIEAKALHHTVLKLKALLCMQ